MAGCQFSHFLAVNDIIWHTAAVKQVHLQGLAPRQRVSDNASEGGDAAAAGQKDQIVAIDERLMVEVPGRAGAFQFIAHLHLVEQVGRHKTARIVSHGQCQQPPVLRR